MNRELDFLTTERLRLKEEYQRRAREVSQVHYAPWHPAEILVRSSIKRKAALMLHDAGVFPCTRDHCLEIGFGTLGWLGDLITWGVRETDLYGIELDESRVRQAKELLPTAKLFVGDAARLPWRDHSFRLVIASTVFTSILDHRVRTLVAEEITRVLSPTGALLWYDFEVNNPSNEHVRKVDRKELKQLFPQLSGEIKSVTLAPPLARFVAPKSWALANLLEAIPLLRTHLLAVLLPNP